jgi:hypothetical protein
MKRSMETDKFVAPKMVLFFRSLIIASLAFAIIGAVYAEVAVGYVSEDWQNLYSWRDDGGVFDIIENYENIYVVILMIILFAFLIIWMIYSAIGLFLFHKIARKLNLYLWCFVFLLYPLLGLQIYFPIEYFFYELSNLASTGVLFLSYFSEIKHKFESE